jgi:hypothetical protein
MKALAILTCAVTLGLGAPAFAEPVVVKFTEGVAHAFLVLRSVADEKLAQGELIQVPRGDRVENRSPFGSATDRSTTSARCSCSATRSR